MKLDRSSPMPLWAQLETVLRERLGRGDFDERFPTDSELVDEFGVSRHTVREAVRHLNKAGVLRRERGRGTVVNRAEFEQPLGALYSLFGSVEASGIEQRSVVRELCETTDSAVAERLGLPVDAPLFFLERLRFAGTDPLALDRAWLSMADAGVLLDANFERTALYDELDRRSGLRPDAGWERLAPLNPTADERALLKMRRGEAAMLVERLGSYRDRPIEWRTTIVRGDRYRFVSHFRSGVAPSLVASTGH